MRFGFMCPEPLTKRIKVALDFDIAVQGCVKYLPNITV